MHNARRQWRGIYAGVAPYANSATRLWIKLLGESPQGGNRGQQSFQSEMSLQSVGHGGQKVPVLRGQDKGCADIVAVLGFFLPEQGKSGQMR